jgi:hypothetical protein
VPKSSVFDSLMSADTTLSTNTEQKLWSVNAEIGSPADRLSMQVIPHPVRLAFESRRTPPARPNEAKITITSDSARGLVFKRRNATPKCEVLLSSLRSLLKC